MARTMSKRISSVKSFDVSYVTTGTVFRSDTGTTKPIQRSVYSTALKSGRYLVVLGGSTRTGSIASL